MSTRRTTTATERIDMHLTRVEQFLEVDLVGEAIARARAALAQCEQELREAEDDETRAAIETRRGYVVYLLQMLTDDVAPDRRPRATI